MPRRLFGCMLVPLFACILTAGARADLIIEFDNITMPAGGVGSINVFIRSNRTDQIAQFNTLFRITRISGEGILEFQPTAQQSPSETAASNYVFHNDSNDFVSNRDPNTRTELTQSDFASANVEVGVGTINRKLLGRLELVQILPADQIATFAGAKYEVSLIRNTTFFNMDDYDTRVPFQAANVGTVTVAAVPEPSACLLLLSTIGAYLIRRNQRSHQWGQPVRR